MDMIENPSKQELNPPQLLLTQQFNQVRNKTLELVKTLEKDDFIVQTAFYTSPPKWHLGHVSWIYEAIMQKIDPNYEFYSKEFSEYLNSYYQQFGQPLNKGRRGIVSRPTTEQIFQYFEIINSRMIKFIKENLVDTNPHHNDAIQLITMGFHHECQHQELLVYDLQHLLADRYMPVKRNPPPTISDHSKPQKESILIKGGLYSMGYNGNKYCYDIELPEHTIYLNDYKLDSFPVTNGEYIKFIEDGGYQDYKYWLSDGWEKVKENEWTSPEYWQKVEGNQWIVQDFAGRRKINPNEAVCHVSYYEADAYCKWLGKRLPTEAEWEKAACWNEKEQRKTIFPWGDDQATEKHANLLESNIWHCTDVGSFPQGKSHMGCYQMIGDVWEWTSSEFVGYPGFKTGFAEYNDKWFANQKVLRGGSFGTPKMSIRASYRNFFKLDERWMFSGFRCAQDA
jgi:ergothioneine biosynthesis protein EgtB